MNKKKKSEKAKREERERRAQESRGMGGDTRKEVSSSDIKDPKVTVVHQNHSKIMTLRTPTPSLYDLTQDSIGKRSIVSD